jgi:hypothetical protein
MSQTNQNVYFESTLNMASTEMLFSCLPPEIWQMQVLLGM